MSKTKTEQQTMTINVGSERAPKLVTVPTSFVETSRQHGLPDVDAGKAWLQERTTAFKVARTLSGAHREQDINLGLYKARVAMQVRRSMRSESIAESVADALAKAQYIAGLDAESRKLLGKADPAETTPVGALLAGEATLPQ